jgi:hypothetical protein
MARPNTRAARTSRSDSSGESFPSALRRVSVRVGIWISCEMALAGNPVFR